MFKAEIWIFSTLFAVGVIVGLSFLLIFGSGDPGARDSSEPNPDDLATVEQPDAQNQWLAEDDSNFAEEDASDQEFSKLRDEGDRFLIAGNYISAALRFKKLQHRSGRFTSGISIRLGICAELDEQPGAAAAHYRRALEAKSPTTHRWMALSGLSRTWTARGNRPEAMRILYELFLDSLSDPAMPTELQAQANFQLGMVLQDIVLQNYHYDLSQANGIAFENTPPEIGAIVELLNELPESETTPVRPSSQATPAFETASTLLGGLPDPFTLSSAVTHRDGRPVELISADEHPQITILQRPTDSIDLTMVHVQSTLQPIAAIIKHLAASCELELFASPQAQLMITGRTKSLNIKGVQGSLLLDSLLVPLNLIWLQDDAGIHLVSLEESTSANTAEFWPGALERTLRRFNVAFPGDYRIPSALLSRANLNFLQDDFDRAATHYQQLSNLAPKEELLARLFFNTGKLEMRLGRNEEAIRHFYHAVDQSYDTDFQSSCYWLIGQLSLETNHLDEAIKASGRALSTARIDQQKRLAALTMARSYLLSNKPYSANQVLFDNRRSFEGTDLEPTAAVLGCYARYVGVSDESSLNSESKRLLAAVAMAPDRNYESFIDIYIAARAYQQLGFQDRAIEKLTLAAESTTISSWRRQFLFELGVQLMIAGQRQKAATVFEFLVNEQNDQWVKKSLLQLAQIYLHQRQFQNCIDICQRLWSGELDETEKKSTLDAMGRAYRELGEHHSAALCFAGMLPASTME